MPQLATLPHAPRPAVTDTLTVSVAADAHATQRALDELDLFGPAIRALRAVGLADQVTHGPAEISWRPDPRSGRIHVAFDVRVAPDDEDGTSLTLVSRCSASDQPTHERLLDAWPILGPLTATLVKRAARAAKHHAEQDRFEASRIEEVAIAA